MLTNVLLLAALASVDHPANNAAAKDGILIVKPGASLSRISERLAKDASVTTIVFEAGIYSGGFTIPPLEGADPETHPLLIRAVEGAAVVFEGARPVAKAKAVAGRPGVFSAPFESVEKREPPKIWEPKARLRYLFAADLDSVQRFPASYIVLDDRIYFHTSDGKAPRAKAVLGSVQDFGLSVQRRFVTVRGLRFRNFTARAKWSAAVQMRADHVTVEHCEVANASFGFTLLSDDDALLDSTARDVGGGVYVQGKRGRVERNRFLKARDFVVPTYSQDDTGIQGYYPAESGIIRGNLAIGFGMGILIKANPSPWVVEENTLISGGDKDGFLATEWHADAVFRRNVVAGYAVPATFVRSRTAAGVANNCFDVPRFVDAASSDYRLAQDSPCLGSAGGKETMGAGEVARSPDRIDLRAANPSPDAGSAAGEAKAAPARAIGAAEDAQATTPRTWTVSPAGRDRAAGSADAPLRSIQEAVDRAGPGDTVLLQPGIYSEAVRFDHGGEEGRPITLRSADRWKAVLDGARRQDELIRIETAPFVVIRDLEIRWFRVAGVRVVKSPDVRVEGCRIWNAHWGGLWPEGDGVMVEESLRFTGTGNVLYNQERGFELLSSPGAAITRNTAVANLYGGVIFVHSLEGSTCTNNDFSYQGNDAVAIFESEGGKGRLASLVLDYNNYGLTLSGGPEPSLQRLDPRPRDRHLATVSKAIVYFEESPAPYRRFRTMAAWREFSGLDAHSIFADPLFVDSKSGDFRLEAQSPDRGAGTDGGTIGAFPD